ncbi:MAG: hypothetical protein SF182_11040 [Deltaproteobacteria bacterium]|nr:hypothetical protein [Deltaproteobacteria bacterium]
MRARAAGRAAVGLALLLTACGTAQSPRPPVFTELLAVLPLGEGPEVRPGATPQEDGGAIVTAQIYKVLAEQTEFRFAPDLSVVDALATPELRLVRGTSERAVALGRALGADVVLSGTVTRFAPRVGTALGASQGASVAFNLILVEVASGEVVWQGAYDQTQEALATNFLDVMLFWQAGARWLTASELAGIGVEQLWPQIQAAITSEAPEPTESDAQPPADTAPAEAAAPQAP